jgi:hypothetical protein
MITIPDPCKEDFSKMTPTERGAFCTKCSTDTFDFRNLSTTDINQIIKEHAGEHICGRFKKSQLQELNAGFLNWKNQTRRTFQSKFLLACVLVFGLGLFSCENEENAIMNETNRTEITKSMDPIASFINKEFDIANIDLLDFVSEDVLEPIIGYEIMYEEEIAGDIAYEQDVIEYNNHGTIMAGMIAYDPGYITYIEAEEVDTSKESTLAEPIEIDPKYFEATAYPNPTQMNSTIALDISEEGQFDIMMYDINGQLVNNIHSGNLSNGRQQFEVEMSHLNAGMYIVKVISQGQNETLKIQKIN